MKDEEWMIIAMSAVRGPAETNTNDIANTNTKLIFKIRFVSTADETQETNKNRVTI